MSLEKTALLPSRHFAAILMLVTCLAIGAVLLMAWQIIERSVADEEDSMIHALVLRAQSLGWAVEGAARLHKANLADLLVEMGQQPGIVYIALVGDDGRIVLDSNPALTGQHLYTSQELNSLSPANFIQGRFSPDDANIFETWKIFHPGRIRGHHLVRRLTLFIALDAADFQKELKDYENRLLVEAALLLLLLLFASGLVYFAFNYHLSRRRLDDSQALAKQIIDSYPSPLLVTDMKGRIKFRNGEAEKLFAIKGNAASLVILPGLDWKEITDELCQGKTAFERELKFHAPDGIFYPVSLSDAIIRDRSGVPIGWLIILRDLREIKDLEKQLADSRRMAALGHMAAGVAHEIRNPLSSIRGYAGYLRQRLEGNAWAAATASLLEEEAIRLDKALSDLLLLSKKPKLKCESVSIAVLLNKLLLLLEPESHGRGINIRLDMPESDARLYLDKDRMLQALLNIALNAIEATRDGGEIVIGCRIDSCGSSPCVISITDNGCGIPPGDLEQIFTPYFTTRAEGSGLGLTITRQIVEAHGGRIVVSSIAGHGTTFNIHLPVEAACQNVP